MKIFQAVHVESNFKALYAYNEKGQEIYINRNNKEEWFVYKDDLLIKHIDSSGFERIFEYDVEGKIIHTKATNGLEEWWEYDDNGHKKTFKNSRGKENYYEYSPEAKLLYSSSSKDGVDATIYRYDDRGNKIYEKYKLINREEWWEYNTDGKNTCYKNNQGEEEWMEYDEKGRLITTKKNNGDVEKRFYDDDDRLIRTSWSSGMEHIYQYDDRGNQTYYKLHVVPELKDAYEERTGLLADELEEWQDFNDQNLLVHYKRNDGFEKWITYDAYGNEISFKDSSGVDSKKQYLYYEQLTDNAEWLFPFKQL